MNDIELVIKIPEELYKAAENGFNEKEIWDLRLAIVNGIQLPKGHGRLADMDEAIKCLEEVNGEDAIWAISLIDWACSKRVVIDTLASMEEDDE